MAESQTIYIPTPPAEDGKWMVRVDFLEGAFYRLLFKYNVRDSSWYFDIANDAGVAQVRGRRVVLGTDILAAWKTYKEVPQGVLSIVDTTGLNVEPTKDTLGDAVKLEYVTVGDE